MLHCLFLQGHAAHFREYSSDAKCCPVSCGPGSTEPHCTSHDTQGQVSLGAPRSSAGWEWKRGKPSCRMRVEEGGNRPGWITTPSRQYKPLENAISSSAYTKLNDLNNSINCFGFLDRHEDREKIIRKKKYFLWKQVMFQTCKNFLMHSILHTCLSPVSMFLFCWNYTVCWLPCYNVCLTKMPTFDNYFSSMSYIIVQIKSLWH